MQSSWLYTKVLDTLSYFFTGLCNLKESKCFQQVCDTDNNLGIFSFVKLSISSVRKGANSEVGVCRFIN